MSTFKSTLLANRDATPKVLTDGYLAGGMVSETKGSVLLTAAGAGTAVKLISVPSNARIQRLLWQDGTGASGSSKLDVATWYPTVLPTGGGNFLASGSSGAILNSSMFATALSPADTATGLTEITNQSGNYLIPLQETPLWNVLGFTADPEISFDMGFSVRTATTVSSYVGLSCTYVF